MFRRKVHQILRHVLGVTTGLLQEKNPFSSVIRPLDLLVLLVLLVYERLN